MADSFAELADAQAVEYWSPDEQFEWAEEYGEALWNEYGDDEVVAEMTDEERAEDKEEAWNVVYGEHENRINADLGVVTDNSNRQDDLLDCIEDGFKSAHS